MSSKSGIIPAHPTCLNLKKLHSEKGLIRNIQLEYAVYMTCIKFGILPYSEYKWKTSEHVLNAHVFQTLCPLCITGFLLHISGLHALILILAVSKLKMLSKFVECPFYYRVTMIQKLIASGSMFKMNHTPLVLTMRYMAPEGMTGFRPGMVDSSLKQISELD